MIHKLIINIVIYLLNLGSSAVTHAESMHQPVFWPCIFPGESWSVGSCSWTKSWIWLAIRPDQFSLTLTAFLSVSSGFFFHDYMHQYFAFKIRSSIFQFSLKVACMCMFVYELDVCVCVASLFSKDGSFYAASSSSPLLSSCRKVAA